MIDEIISVSEICRMLIILLHQIGAIIIIGVPVCILIRLIKLQPNAG